MAISKAQWLKVGWSIVAVAAVELVGAVASLFPWYIAYVGMAAVGGYVAYFLEEKFAGLK